MQGDAWGQWYGTSGSPYRESLPPSERESPIVEIFNNEPHSDPT